MDLTPHLCRGLCIGMLGHTTSTPHPYWANQYSSRLLSHVGVWGMWPGVFFCWNAGDGGSGMNW